MKPIIAAIIGGFVGLILFGLVLCTAINRVACDTTLRVDETGIALSDPCGNLR